MMCLRFQGKGGRMPPYRNVFIGACTCNYRYLRVQRCQISLELELQVSKLYS